MRPPMQRANLEVQLVRYSQGTSYGLRLPNGSWTDMLGEVQKGVVDTMAADFTPSRERQGDFYFTPPFSLATDVLTVGGS